MKKSYIEPVVRVITISAPKILTSSEELLIDIFTDKEESTENALSRHSNIWEGCDYDDDDF